MQSNTLKQLWVLMATAFLDMVGGLMVLPLLPFYAQQMGLRPRLVGLLISIFFLAQFVTAPLWGRFSDRYGRRPVLLIGMGLSAVSFAFFGLASTFWQLLVFRLIQGAGGGTTGVLNAYISDSVPPEDRAKALGWLSAATSAGVMVGPFLGSQARHFGHSAPGYFAAVLCALNVLSAWIWLPESKKSPEPGAAEVKRRPLLQSFLDVLLHPRASVSSLIWVYTIGMMAFMAMNGILALYLGQVYQITEYTVGLYYSYIGAVGVVMRAILLGPLVRRFREVGVMRLGALSLVAGLSTLPIVGTIHAERPVRLLMLGLVVILVPIGTALLFPATTALVSWRARREETGQVMGVQQAMGSVARIIGPLWATWIYERDVRYPFWLSAALMLGVSVLTWRQKETKAPAPAVSGEQTA